MSASHYPSVWSYPSLCFFWISETQVLLFCFSHLTYLSNNIKHLSEMTADHRGGACGCQECQSKYLGLKMLCAKTFPYLIAVTVAQCHAFMSLSLRCSCRRSKSIIWVPLCHNSFASKVLCIINTLWALQWKLIASGGFTLMVFMFEAVMVKLRYPSTQQPAMIGQSLSLLVLQVV